MALSRPLPHQTASESACTHRLLLAAFRQKNRLQSGEARRELLELLIDRSENQVFNSRYILFTPFVHQYFPVPKPSPSNAFYAVFDRTYPPSIGTR